MNIEGMGMEILMRARVGERIMEGGAESRGNIRIPRDGAGAGCWGGRLMVGLAYECE